MRLIKDQDYRTGVTKYILEVDDHDQMLADFDWFDTLLMRDCELPGSTIADKLLALEMMARRIEEGYQRAIVEAAGNT